MCTVQDLLRRAAFDSRKQHLWDMFGKYYSLSSIVETDVLEMVETSHKIPINDIDKRIDSFRDEFNNIQVSWRDFFLQMHRSPAFTHCITLSGNDSITYHIVYVQDHDLFLSLRVRHHGIDEACILVRDKERTDKMEFAGIAHQFIDHVSQWLFMSCCQFSVT